MLTPRDVLRSVNESECGFMMREASSWMGFVLTLCFLISMLPNSSRAEQPRVKNVLFLISDDLKASVLGCYGDAVCQTPNIDRLAERSVVFDRAYCQGTLCFPSRQSFMFSKYQGVGPVNLGEHFKANGYYSARVGKIYHMAVPGDIIAGTDGRDHPESWTESFNSPGREAHTPGDFSCLNLNIFTTELAGRQSTQNPHRMFVAVEYDGEGVDQPDSKSATKAIELLNEHSKDPFFLAVGFVRPHYPMVAPRRYFEPYPWDEMTVPEFSADDLDDIPRLGRTGTVSTTNPIGEYPDNQKRMWSSYYATVTFMDEQVGRVLDELDRLGLRDSTAIVFLSDHGYHLGEHGLWQKSNLHEEVVRVPLMVSVPGINPGRSESLVELVDLFPTLSELAGLAIPNSVQGKSLVPVLENPQLEVRDSSLSYTGNGFGLRTNDWAYMKYKDGTEELYDMRVDPDQLTNLADSPGHQEQRDQLEALLHSRLKQGEIATN
ncbi:sulfatase [Thalassoglobus neptunius]|nr:sulfatase [Thalassoglobus neptunius]